MSDPSASATPWPQDRDGSWPGPPEPAADHEPASLLPRFFARLTDLVLVGILGTILINVVLMDLLLHTYVGGGPTGAAAHPVAAAVSAVLLGLLLMAYLVAMEVRFGGSVGKLMLRLRVLGAGGGRPSVRESLLRNSWNLCTAFAVTAAVGQYAILLQTAAMIAIAVTVGLSPLKQGWHDRLAGGTRVVRHDPEPVD